MNIFVGHSNFRRIIVSKEQSKTVVTPTGRIAFPNIAEKGEMSKKYDLNLIFDKEQYAEAKEMIALAVAVAKKKWPNGLPEDFINPFKKCSEKEEYDGFKDGFKYITPRSTYRPGVVDKKRNTIDLEDLDSRLYGGCYARLSLTAYHYDKAGNRGVGFGLQAIQVVKDGEPFGNRVDAENAFDPIDDDDTEFDADDEFGFGADEPADTGTKGNEFD